MNSQLRSRRTENTFSGPALAAQIDKPKTKSWTLEELSNAFHGPGNGFGDIYYIDLSALKIEH
jgi:hypothetical protein